MASVRNKQNMKCNKLVCKDFLQTVTVLGCRVVDHRTHILSPGVPASFEAAEEDGEGGGGQRAESRVGRGRTRRRGDR